MDYKFLSSKIDADNINLQENNCINKFVFQNNYAEILKAVEFLKSEDVLLYVHGFLGTGKRQFVNYIQTLMDKDVVKLEYYCKASTVCDDILLAFIGIIEKETFAKTNLVNAKITTLSVKILQYVSTIKKKFAIVLHSLDDVKQDNLQLIIDVLEQLSQLDNVKIIASTRALLPDIFGKITVGKKVFLKAFSKDIFKDFLLAHNINCADLTLEDFYKCTRGYYYYTALAIKIIQAMKISLNDFLTKYVQSGMTFDSFLGITYVNMVPPTIRNFFWFLRTVRHGISINALAVFELFDEFSLEYLKNNLMIFVVGETIYVQDYFQQDIDISIPAKTEIKLHKYIIGIYEKQLKEPLQSRVITISRQALREEIEYHNNKIMEIETAKERPNKVVELHNDKVTVTTKEKLPTIDEKFQQAKKMSEAGKNTEAIEIYNEIINSPKADFRSLEEARTALAKIYKIIGNYTKAQHYYELVENNYKKNNEVINLNYLYYELTDLYFLMYKNERAIETIKKVIYSVDTPQSLMVSACTLLGNIYSSLNNSEEAYAYYRKALESLDNNTPDSTKAELYFKFALVNDDKEEEQTAFEYYIKCTTMAGINPYKALAYYNMGACYFDNLNYSDAKSCFTKAYDIEKNNNNYDGIYYSASYLAKIYIKENNPLALNFLQEAKQSAEFINEEFYILESTLALGDYYYNNISLNKKALTEYFNARKIAQNMCDDINIAKINNRIKDMKLRMDSNVFNEIESKYG